MKKFLLLIIYNVSLIAFCTAQNPLVKQWDKRFGGEYDDVLPWFQQTKDGGYILGGTSTSDSSGDKSQNNWDTICNIVCKNDYWIVKTDSLGNKQWDKTFGGDSRDYLNYIQQTADGGYILGGKTDSDSSGDKTQNTWHNNGFSTNDYWIIKLDSSGNKQWDRDYGGTLNDELITVQQTIDGGYILGGSSYSDSSGDKSQDNWHGAFGSNSDYWILKIDSLGNKQWDKDLGGTNDDWFTDLQQTADGGFIIAGSSASDISGDKTQNAWGFYELDYWIIKIDSLGNKQWDKDFGGYDGEELCAIQQTSDMGFILGGYSGSDSSGDKTQDRWGNDDYWIVKTDSVGNKLWDKDFGGTDFDYLYSLHITSDNGFLMSGASYSNIGGDKTENNLSARQEWIIKTDSLANKQWDKTIFTNGSFESGYLNIQTKDGCFAFSIWTNAGIGGYKTQTCWGSTDYWLIKFCDTTSTTSITQLPNQPNTFSISPNPAVKELKIKNAELKIKEIEIYDLLGRKVFHSSFNIQHSSFSIDISSLSPGIYFLKAGNEVRKFVKQ